MKAAVRELLRHLFDLGGTTLTVWWLLLPRLGTLFLLGWGASELSLWLGAVVSQHNGWLALLIFALGIVATLVSYVLMLRAVGRVLGVGALVPEAEQDATRLPVVQVLALTLLPFLGIYSVFDYIKSEVSQLSALSFYVGGGVFGSEGLLGRLDPRTSRTAMVVTAGVVVGCYLVRRLLDHLHERTGWRPLGLAAAYVEACFILALLLSGGRLLESFQLWWQDRQFHQWIATAVEGLSTTLAPLRIEVPELIAAIGSGLAQLWSWTLDGVLEPVAWLAVAALVFGSQVLTVADLWRTGQPVGSATPRRARAIPTGDRGRVRRAGLALQELFAGDLDDRYLPTWQSIRLVLHAGTLFLAAFVLLHATVDAASHQTWRTFTQAIGGREAEFWVGWGTAVHAVIDLVFDTVRLTLLVVTFQRALLAFRSHSHPVDRAADDARQGVAV